MQATGQNAVSEAEAMFPDEPWGLLLILSMIGFLLIGGMLTSLSVYVSVMQAHFGWSEAAMGGGPVMLLLGMSIGNLSAGALMRRLGVKGLFLVGVSAALCGWIAAGLVRSLDEFMAAMALSGIGTGVATIVPGIAVISQCFHRRRGLAVALFIGASALASSIMPVVSRWLIEAAGWRQAFWIFGSIVGLIGLPLLCRLPRSIDGDQRLEHQVSGLSAEQGLKLPAFWILTLVLTISQFGMNAILFNLIAYLRKTGFSGGDAVTLFGIANFMSLPGLMIGGYLSDRISGRIILPLILLIQGAGTLALLGAGNSHFAILLFILCWGGVAGLPAQAGSMLLSEIIGQRTYAAMLGIVFTVNGFLAALAPAIMGWAYETTGGYSRPIFAIAALCLLAACASTFCRARPARDESTLCLEI
jgi:MFS family permease